ncbi:TPA: CDP-paratose synthase [Salmonella enterica subsp. enterica serovar Typhi str. AG3]|uniref:CDP-paratose synthase n=4 Tax=Salmonella enterica I TaxID=59201 RepID=A0A719B3T1_SALTS|nr:CDP-paratose synthase [Salmonella enterica]HAD0201482.1 CDP-paratose synthase [Salmonella enterica subsp. enterica serovar Typhimurium]HAD6493057.1 CDP-paratose synthase [Salmonella enterica subsp. enterica serovar Typhimurium str. SL1344]HAE0517446.1 CDP-paratose synthase [Salmonella enterica subsp. enterica serovar Enteritidis str. P125109]HCG3792917.1 CDP-paratose synthase [Salmonella enterica subsp. enterica serovar Typhi str. AG3]EBV3163712.1 CDP-paratose synthase [Salmonella enterica 
MKILIMGAFGFLGSRLTSYFESRHTVIGLARKRNNAATINNIIYTTENNWIEKIVEFEPNIIINTIACYGRHNEPATALIESNILMPIRVLESISSLDAVFINCGTSLPPNTSLYAYTKQKANELAAAIIDKVCGKYIELKLEHFYGAFDGDDKFTSMVIRRCLSNQPVKLTSGLQQRDFLYIKDLLTAFDCIINNVNNFPKFHSIEVGSGKAISIREYVETVKNITKSNSIIEFGVVKERANELMYSCADIAELEKIGWKREFSLVDALTEIIEEEGK